MFQLSRSPGPVEPSVRGKRLESRFSSKANGVGQSWSWSWKAGARNGGLNGAKNGPDIPLTFEWSIRYVTYPFETVSRLFSAASFFGSVISITRRLCLSRNILCLAGGLTRESREISFASPNLVFDLSPFFVCTCFVEEQARQNTADLPACHPLSVSNLGLESGVLEEQLCVVKRGLGPQCVCSRPPSLHTDLWPSLSSTEFGCPIDHDYCHA